MRFKRGDLYSRAEVAELVGYPAEKRDGGVWMTGATEFAGSFYVFANLGVPGRTGHDYQNHWLGTDLAVSTRGNARRGQPQLERMLSGDHPVYIFWRASKHPCFTYAGEGRPSDVSDTEPPVITWSLDGGSVADDHATELPLARGAFRRGPAPTTGQRFVVVTNVSSDLYLAVLRGLRSQTFVHVKIGVTCDTRRRMRELNWSLPEATGIGWSLYSVWRFEDAETAYAMETRLLEAMRLKGWWSMGEFGAIPQSAFLEFAASFDEIGLHPAAVTSAPV